MSQAYPASMVDVFGRHISLINIDAGVADFEMLRVQLSRLARYNGSTDPDACAYNVLQHEILGSLALLREGRTVYEAAAFQYHDHHEGPIGDMTRPVKASLLMRIGPEHSQALEHAIDGLKADIDAQIYPAAGLMYPLDPETKALVKKTDERMLDYENLHFRTVTSPAWHHLHDPIHPDEPIEPFSFAPAIWPEKLTRRIGAMFEEVLQKAVRKAPRETLNPAPLIAQIHHMLGECHA